jgi:hypothetical protein
MHVDIPNPDEWKLLMCAHLWEGRARKEAGRRQGAASSDWPVSGWGGLKPGASLPLSSVTRRPGWSCWPLSRPFTETMW